MRGSQLRTLVIFGSVCATLVFVFQFGKLWATKTVVKASQQQNARDDFMAQTKDAVQIIVKSLSDDAVQSPSNDAVQPPNTGIVKPLSNDAIQTPSNGVVKSPSNDAVQLPSNGVVKPPSNDAVQPQSNGASPPQTKATETPLPSDVEIAKLNEIQLMKIYSDYMQKTQVTCNNVQRVGRQLDGGKDVCLDEKYFPKTPCLVYSFGSCNDFSFDNDVVKKFGCDVHVFDPSMNQTSRQISDHVWFYNWGLGNVNAVNDKKWTMKTLDVIMKELGHANRTLDMLKIDIEGDEWRAIPQMVATGVIKYARQILMELHFGRERPSAKFWGSSQDLNAADHMKALRQLYEAGFRMFRIEENHWGLFNWPGLPGRLSNVHEIYTIQV